MRSVKTVIYAFAFVATFVVLSQVSSSEVNAQTMICTPGNTQVVNCSPNTASNGCEMLQKQTCNIIVNGGSAWVNSGACYKRYSTCGVCYPNKTETLSCNTPLRGCPGTKTRTCNSIGSMYSTTSECVDSSNFDGCHECTSDSQCANGYLCNPSTHQCYGNPSLTGLNGTCGRDQDPGAPVCCTRTDGQGADEQCRYELRSVGVNGEKYCMVGRRPDCERSTPVPSASPSTPFINAQCIATNIYSPNWTPISKDEFFNLLPNSQVYFCVNGGITSSTSGSATTAPIATPAQSCTQTCTASTTCKVGSSCGGTLGAKCGTTTDGKQKYKCVVNTCTTNCIAATTSPTTIPTPKSVGSFDMARFTINGVLRPDVTTQRPGSADLCDLYTIPAGTYSIKVQGEIHHTLLGWL